MTSPLYFPRQSQAHLPSFWLRPFFVATGTTLLSHLAYQKFERIGHIWATAQAATRVSDSHPTNVDKAMFSAYVKQLSYGLDGPLPKLARVILHDDKKRAELYEGKGLALFQAGDYARMLSEGIVDEDDVTLIPFHHVPALVYSPWGLQYRPSYRSGGGNGDAAPVYSEREPLPHNVIALERIPYVLTHAMNEVYARQAAGAVKQQFKQQKSLNRAMNLPPLTDTDYKRIRDDAYLASARNLTGIIGKRQNVIRQIGTINTTIANKLNQLRQLTLDIVNRDHAIAAISGVRNGEYLPGMVDNGDENFYFDDGKRAAQDQPSREGKGEPSREGKGELYREGKGELYREGKGEIPDEYKSRSINALAQERRGLLETLTRLKDEIADHVNELENLYPKIPKEPYENTKIAGVRIPYGEIYNVPPMSTRLFGSALLAEGAATALAMAYPETSNNTENLGYGLLHPFVSGLCHMILSKYVFKIGQSSLFAFLVQSTSSLGVNGLYTLMTM